MNNQHSVNKPAQGACRNCLHQLHCPASFFSLFIGVKGCPVKTQLPGITGRNGLQAIPEKRAQWESRLNDFLQYNQQ